MKCARCNRPLNKPAAVIQRNGKEMVLGPKCAAMALGRPARTRVPKPAIPLVEVDPRQMALELEAV